MNQSLRVLIVEDSPDDAELLIIALEDSGYQTTHQLVDNADSLQAALNQSSPWDVVIADHSMPQFSAQAAFQLVHSKGLDLPFIVVSGTISEQTAISLMNSGVKDYIVKGKLNRLVAVVERELKESVLRKQHKQALQQIHFLSYYDELTGLPNQSFLLEILGNHLNKDEDFAVFYLDLDRSQKLKYTLNDCLNEQILITTVQRLKDCLPSSSTTLARLQNHEFAIILTDIKNPEEAFNKAALIQEKLSLPFNLDGLLISSSSSIGIVMSGIEYDLPKDFLQAANHAMNEARKLGKGKTALFAREMKDFAYEKLYLETDLQKSIERQEFHLNYQPIVSLTTGKIIAFEALVRWQHPTRGLISPSDFIPLAEETGLIIPLGQWILSEACQKLSRWKKKLPKKLPLKVSVNLSSIQLSDPNLIKHIDHLLESLEFNGECLKLEITETVFIENFLNVIAILEQIKERKIQICIDDFGTGYSSLSYLHNLPIDTLKIDRSFLEPNNAKNLDIVKNIVSLAHDLNLDIIAEGVETREQMLMLQSLKCEYAQGYFFSRPLSYDKIVPLINKSEYLIID